MENQTFKQFGLKQNIVTALDSMHFTTPTPIQKQVIPATLGGKDIIGESHTGSGKTLAFLIPILEQIDPADQFVQAVITAPTRELVNQLYNEADKLVQHSGYQDVRIQRLVGGTEKSEDIKRLKHTPQIIIGTPHRIFTMIEEGVLSLFETRTFVVDEADLMIDLGLINDVDKVLVRINPKVQLLVFSATIPVRLEHFLKKYLQNPLHVKIDHQKSPKLLTHKLISRRHRETKRIISEIAKIIQPYLCIIFTNSKDDADQLFRELVESGLNTGILHGGLSPRERKRVVKDIESLRYEYIVATDLASRGIDIAGVSHVINAQLPKEEEFYIHRVGRTARAGLEGTAISIYEADDIALLETLEETGVEFSFVEPKNGDWKEANRWDKRQTRKKTRQNLDEEVWKHVRKPKKVKPGYKKKMRREQEAIKKQLMRRNKKRR